MAKQNTIFECEKCGAQSPKWSGRCLECGSWGTLKESAGQTSKQAPAVAVKFNHKNLVDLKDISDKKFSRIICGLPEVDQILGGGLVQGSITLLGGEPGIGKSTLVLQILQSLEKQERPLLYVSGEESAEQIKLRMNRLAYDSRNLKFLAETDINQICAAITEIKPALAVIDSIQTIYDPDTEGAAGNLAQIRVATVKILETVKKLNIPIIITGHVTKDGAVAGPKTLEHLVDTVIYLEGDKLHGFRILRPVKNRFGQTGDIGVMEMTAQGLAEVKDPGKAFIRDKQEQISGSVISCFMEGNRPFLVEVQALVSPTIFGFPQRKTAGYDLNRLQMISAVLLKRAGLNLANQDIHLNLAGGFKVKEPAIDLAVATAIHSAAKDSLISPDTIILGEIGLGGEIRPVPHLEKRLLEAERLGFKKAIIPAHKTKLKSKLQIKNIKSVNELNQI